MKKVLIVDDDQAVCKMLQKFLSNKGYEAIIALKSDEALRKLKEEKPRVVILDIIMPNVNGLELLGKIKEADKDVIVIMLTAVQGESVIKKSLEMGAGDYITKPLSLDYLEAVLTRKLIDVG